VGMASGTTDLQRDLGGSIMQAILGSVLTAGYAFSMATQIGDSPDAAKVTDETEATLQLSYSSAEKLGEQYPQYAQAITSAARESFLSGGNWAYAAAAATIALGAVLVFTAYPGKAKETELLQTYAKADAD
jgi:DHA2 family multidrug resistance protein-like MFS transporter